ncbi:hypothetical protein [Streptomyces sp. NPDC060027]|uniref:hypothetical protein n=1 Tax=Streptomyces sp. NPDC060027 TaxID=3347040 RepID=UPI003687122F
MLRVASALVSTAVVATGIVAGTAGTASAACAPSPGKCYHITNKSTVSKPTKLHSEYDNLGGNLTYNHSKTATVSASGTAVSRPRPG